MHTIPEQPNEHMMIQANYGNQVDNAYIDGGKFAESP